MRTTFIVENVRRAGKIDDDLSFDIYIRVIVMTEFRRMHAEADEHGRRIADFKTHRIHRREDAEVFQIRQRCRFAAGMRDGKSRFVVHLRP